MSTYLKVPPADLSTIESESHGSGLRNARLEKISKWMQLAVLAAEDHRFYEHRGIDSLGLIRAGIDNIKAGNMIEGASTISQQLAKIGFLDQEERTARRKFSQLILAVELEDRYTKKQILEAYLNTIYFGRGAYGIEAASKSYFGVPAANLSIAQSAFLAGLIRSPSILSLKENLPAARARQHQVIRMMTEYGYINKEQATQANREVLFSKRLQAEVNYVLSNALATANGA
ncbi:MAG: transglycosylase domain-containing protein [Candidatus Obscuribacterales bacterium]|nr:transglycosylase domain-containing protein [Candidatus Obscuribacterales bacterium]